MKTTTKSKRRTLLLSMICAGVVATFLGGCAEGPYVAYDTGYYPTAYYTRTYYTRTYDYYPYSYYYGPTVRYYGSYWY